MGYGNTHRQKAIELKAADAKVLLNSSLPFVFKLMTPAQIQQVQKVLDAAVVNPEVNRKYKELRQKSITAQSGNIVLRDEKIVRQADRLVETYMIPLDEWDKRIRLDFAKLLTHDALKPTTDNPDEAAYLLKIRNTLANRGVWLRIGQPYVRDKEDLSRHMIDPRTFEVWLSVGPDGDTIPTQNGQLTREALLKTTIFGAGYWEEVHQGRTQKALEKEINRLLREIDSGIMQHNMLASIRRQAFPGVAKVSDWLGGADFPDRSIWDHPHKLVLKAMDLNVGGNVSASQAYLVVAAIATRNAAQLIADYIDDTSTGAERAVTILKVAKTAGEVAEVGLAVTGVGAVVRQGAKMVGTKTAKDKAVDAAAEKLVNQMIAKDPSLATDLAQVRWVPGPKGTVLGRGVKANQSTGHGTGWHKW